MLVKPDRIRDRFTITLPDETDRMIVAAIMSLHGVNKSSAIRVALRDWAREHGVLPETLIDPAPATASTNPPAG